MTEKRVCLGKIVAAHGLRDEVKVHSYTDNPADIDKYGLVEDKEAAHKFKIKAVGPHKEVMRLKIEGVNDRNAAEALIGTELYVNRDVLPQLPEEEYYLSDIIGLKVYLNSLDKEIGTVARFSNFGAGEIIEIKLPHRKETEMLPFTKQYVPTINLEEGYIIVSSATMIFADDDSEEENGAEC